MEVRKKVQQRWKDLSARGRKIVRTYARSSPDAGLRARCKVVLSLVQGTSPTMIQRGGLSSMSQVYRVAARFVEDGLCGLSDRREDNGDNKVTEEYKTALLSVLSHSPRKYKYRRPTWTQELLTLVLAKETGIAISRTTMCRLLKRLKVRLGRPKPIVGCPWKKGRRTRRLRAIRRLIQNLPKGEIVVYADEVDIHLNPKIGPDYMLRGTQKHVMTPGKNEKRYLAGALNPITGRLTWVEWHQKNSDLFIALLWQLLNDYKRASCIHVVLDNFKIHDSQRTRLALATAGGRIKLHFLPPYCPDHNKIERLWRDLHDNVTRNHTCATMSTLMEEVYAYLGTRRRALKHEYARLAS